LLDSTKTLNLLALYLVIEQIVAKIAKNTLQVKYLRPNFCKFT